jgi:hypothetical protein
MNEAPPLPSQSSARLLVQGEPLAIPQVLAHAAGRAVLIGLGALLFGAKPEQAVRAALGGAAVIEAMVIFHELTRARA